MMAKLHYPQMCLAITPEDVDGKSLRFTVGGAPKTATLSLATGFWLNNRAQDGLDAIRKLGVAMNTADAAGTITIEWDHAQAGDPTLGYYRIKRTPAAPVELLWDDPLTTLDPELFGFAAAAAGSVATTGGVYIYSTWQAGRLWLPDKWCRRPERKQMPWLELLDRPGDEWERVHVYGDGQEHLTFKMSNVHGLFVHRDRSERADYLHRRRGVVLGDPNVALSSITHPPRGRKGMSHRAPLVWYPSRDDLTQSLQMVVRDKRQKDDVDEIAKEISASPQRYKIDLKCKTYKADP